MKEKKNLVSQSFTAGPLKQIQLLKGNGGLGWKVGSHFGAETPVNRESRHIIPVFL